MKKIRDLGSLPADAFEKYKKSNVKQVFGGFCRSACFPLGEVIRVMWSFSFLVSE